MVCIYCGTKTNVFNSRHQRRNNSVWRRRACPACSSVITTSETVDYEKSWVVRTADGRLAPFLRDKLFISVYKGLAHRPSATSEASALTATIMGNLLHKTSGATLEITTITATVTDVLRRFDASAAAIYSAYHPA